MEDLLFFLFFLFFSSLPRVDHWWLMNLYSTVSFDCGKLCAKNWKKGETYRHTDRQRERKTHREREREMDKTRSLLFRNVLLVSTTFCISWCRLYPCRLSFSPFHRWMGRWKSQAMVEYLNKLSEKRRVGLHWSISGLIKHPRKRQKRGKFRFQTNVVEAPTKRSDGWQSMSYRSRTLFTSGFFSSCSLFFIHIIGMKA